MNTLNKKIIATAGIALVVILFILFDAYFADKETQVFANKPVVQTNVSVPQPIDSTINQPTEEREVAPLPSVKPETFLEKNGRDRLVNTLASGIQYKIIKQGSGKYPNYSDMVDIVSQLRVLDASGQERDRLNSISLSINLRMLPDSFIEAISHVGEGGVTEFFAPPVMATYVPRALLGGVDLEPEDTLVVEITLTEIESEK